MRRGVKPGMSPFRAGALALVFVAVFTFLGFTKFRVPFKPQYEINAVFPTAGTEIKSGSPVRIAGVEVGKVIDVERGKGGTAVARLRFASKGRPIHRDATMKIRPRLFLEGNFFVDVRPGTPAGGEVPDGGTIPVGQTSNAVQFDEVLSALRSDSRADVQATVENLATAFDEGGAEAVNRGFKDWAGAFKGTAIVSEAARGTQPGDLTRFVQAQAKVSSALAARDGELADLVTNFATTVTTLASAREDLGASLRALDSTLTTARPALADLRGALPPLRRFATALRPALRVAPGAIDDALPFVRTTSALLSSPELPALVRDLRPAVSGLRTLQPSLDALLGKVTPIARCVSRNVVPTLTKTLDDGALSTGRPVWQEIALIGPGLASAGSNFDANGTAIRYFAGAGENLVSTALPGVGDLVSLTPEPLLGARPRYTPNVVPPFAPGADCTAQDLPDLRADAAPAPARQRAVNAATPGTLGASVGDAVKRLKSLTADKKLGRALKSERAADRKAGGR
ncbi:MCE family protein [Conexibacter sp. W3-3-2]|uniref:MlaD family protein n=1 Tax=Conexibacter sp. W3-3-2 TaxID=2675227 RepID=UPI0012B8ECCE|nr:MlaD family protein [Conexibacter sp. W3-3-2]MTD43757.1 MCE family protein [Conexibacter sp. W3-3-2]